MLECDRWQCCGHTNNTLLAGGFEDLDGPSGQGLRKVPRDSVCVLAHDVVIKLLPYRAGLASMPSHISCRLNQNLGMFRTCSSKSAMYQISCSLTGSCLQAGPDRSTRMILLVNTTP